MAQVDLALATECAALAPSVHNTQPWRLERRSNVLEVHADRTRQLQFLDPDARQLHISCGIAAEFARLAVRSQQFSCRLELLPNPADPNLLVRLTAGDTEPAAEGERQLVEAMPRRYTDRQPYDDQPLPDDLVERLRRAAERAGGWLTAVNPDDRVALSAILEDAERAEAADPAYAEELARWTHPSKAKDGLNPQSVSAPWPADVVTDVPLRDFSGHAEHPQAGPGEPPRVQRDTVVVLGTADDDPAAWLTAGRVLASVLLTATASYAVAQPLGPGTDFPAARTRLRRELRLVGHPQFVLRLGYGRDRPSTGRRPAPNSATAGSGSEQMDG
jgi:hypothetical protein